MSIEINPKPNFYINRIREKKGRITMSKKRILLFCAVVIIIGCLVLFIRYKVSADSEVLRVEAASAFYPYAVNYFQNNDDYSNLEVDVKLVSTSQAYRDIVDGKADIVVASGPSNEQWRMIERSRAGLEYNKLYLEPLAILVNKENEIDDISVEEIQRIYNNDDPNWNTYQLEKNNGSQTCFESIVKDNKIGKNHFEIRTMPEIVDKVATDKKGIGYSFYSYCSKMYVNDNAKIINVDGKSLEDEDYPLLFEVYLIQKSEEGKVNDVIMKTMIFTKVFYGSLGMLLLVIGLYNRFCVLPKLEKTVKVNPDAEEKINKIKSRTILLIIAAAVIFMGLYVLSLIRCI